MSMAVCAYCCEDFEPAKSDIRGDGRWYHRACWYEREVEAAQPCAPFPKACSDRELALKFTNGMNTHGENRALGMEEKQNG